VTTQADGTFAVEDVLDGDVLVATLDGFETARVPVRTAARIELLVAHATAVTEVTASTLTSSGAAMERLGSTMSAELAQRLPTARPRILQSLPLLPAVVRGPDGQLRIGGTRPHESSLWIDGFDVTDPVTRTSTIDLPNESVKGMAVLRDPIAATFSGVLGSLASIETLAGGDRFRAGLQGFIPRPRLTNYGLGKIEGFFPRAYAGGPFLGAHYFTSLELAYERVPVPGVTSRSGRPDTGTTGLTSFSRVDLSPSASHYLTVDGLFAPGHTSLSGLSPLRPPEASPNVRTRDIVIGLIDHVVLGPADLLTVRVGHVAHGTALAASGTGEALLRPSGWSQNWFAAVDHWGTEQSASATWDHGDVHARGTHTISAVANVRRRTMDATIDQRTIRVLDDSDALRRVITFAPPVRASADDLMVGLGLRDVWDVSARVQVDIGLRADRSEDSHETVLSPRIGVRYAVDDQATTVLKWSAGRFVGYAPLGAFAFDQFPASHDALVDPATNALIRSVTLTPTLATLGLPRADGVAMDVEHRVTPHLEVDAGGRARWGHELPLVNVPPEGGAVVLTSTGTSRYREMHVSVRQAWRPGTEAFVSYVRSSSTGDINDFGTLYTSLTTPMLQPGAVAPTPGDVPHRLRGWATASLPRRIVASPAIEWRTGFPYSVLSVERSYVGTPNNARFPNYFSLDVTTYKTFDILPRPMDFGLQLFNLTRHFNPRDVIPIQGSSNFQHFSNNFGLTVGGYMQVRW
jgi:hypothetical protein